MKSWCYAVRDATNGDKKIVGGMLHAETIDNAVRVAVKAAGLEIVRRVGAYSVDSHWVRNGKKMYLSISAPPEYYLDACPVHMEEVV